MPQQEQMITVAPNVTDDLLANPGMGWQTFHTFADVDPNLAGLPASTCYFRWYWSELEPVAGKAGFALLAGFLPRPPPAGQQLAFRVMSAGTDEAYMRSPRWLKDAGCPGYEFTYGGSTHWTPDHDAPLFLEQHLRLLAELGRRYDGHADVALVDIGSVGLWGEWHFGSTEIVPGGERVPMPSPATCRTIVDAYRSAFPRTPLAMLVGGGDALAYATAHGAGWRADCLGDMGGFRPNWSHMENVYQQHIERAEAGEAWRRGPVAWESCWDMRKWVNEGWDVRYIFDYALEMHGAYINNKSQPLPEGAQYRAEVERLLRRLGYRFVLRSLCHPREVRRGQAVTLQMTWDNTGVAPCYGAYVLGVRLTPLPADGGRAASPTADAALTGRTLRTSINVRGWLPGEREVAAALVLPADLTAGPYQLALGILGRNDRPAVRLGIDGRAADGWYLLSSLQIAE